MNNRKAPGGNLEPTGPVEEATSYTRAKIRAAASDPPRAMLARAAAEAAIGSMALTEARKTVNLAERRERLLLARIQLRKSLLHLEAELETA